jgi:positive regulator of sigma E activity
MTETGIVKSIAQGVAVVQLKRSQSCRTCGVCSCGGTPDEMALRASAPATVQVGDQVAVELDERMRTNAQLWLLAVPLAAFLAGALIARLALHTRELVALGIGMGALAAAFGGVWLADRRLGWSKQPVARMRGTQPGAQK